MEKLENRVSEFAKKHPIITTVALVKLAQSSLVAGAYLLWPDETCRVIGHTYEATIDYILAPSPLFMSYAKEIANVARTPITALRLLV